MVASFLAASLLGLGARWWGGRTDRCLASARQLIEQGDARGALELLPLAESDPTTRERALLLRAQASLALGRPSEAVAPLDAIDTAGPLAAEAAFWKGRTLLEVRQASRAAQWLSEAVSRRPEDSQATRWLAAALYEMGDLSEAAKLLRRVLEIEPEDGRAWRTLALLHKDSAEYDLAEIAYGRTLDLDADQPHARFELAECLLWQGKYTAAVQELERCRGGVPEADRRTLEIRCLEFLDDPDRYRALLASGVAEFPDHPGLATFQARLDLAEGRVKQAIDGFTRVLSVNPYHALSAYQRGLAHRRLGHDRESRADIDRATELNKLQIRMEQLNRRSANHPGDAEPRYELGAICVELGKPELAAEWYLAALACDPRHGGARLGLKWLGREDLLRNPTRRRRLTIIGRG